MDVETGERNDPNEVRLIKVQIRRQKVRSQRDRRRYREYAHPELRISNTWLARAGIQAGDLVAVTAPRPQTLVVSVVERPTERF